MKQHQWKIPSVSLIPQRSSGVLALADKSEGLFLPLFYVVARVFCLVVFAALDLFPLFCLEALMQKKPKSYSAALMDQIPIKYLVTQAQGLQQELGGEMQRKVFLSLIIIIIHLFKEIPSRSSIIRMFKIGFCFPQKRPCETLKSDDVQYFTLLLSHFYVPSNLLAACSTFPFSTLRKTKLLVIM